MTDLLERRASGDERRKTGHEPRPSPPASRSLSPKVLMVGASPPPYYGSIVIFGRLMASPRREQRRPIRFRERPPWDPTYTGVSTRPQSGATGSGLRPGGSERAGFLP